MQLGICKICNEKMPLVEAILHMVDKHNYSIVEVMNGDCPALEEYGLRIAQ